MNTASRDLAAQRARLERKFAALAEPLLGAEDAGLLAGLVGSLGAGVSVRELMAPARPGVRA